MKIENGSKQETLSLSAAALRRDVHEDLERYKRWLRELLTKLGAARNPQPSPPFSAPAGHAACDEASS